MPTTLALGRFGAVISRGLCQILGEAPGLRILGVELDEHALEALVAERAPRVAILDELAAPAVLERLRTADAQLGLIVIAHRPTPQYCMGLFALGANACLAHEVSTIELLTAIRLAAEGRYVLAPTAGRHGRPPRLTAIEALTPREEEVLALLRVGRSNGEIALALHISVETVRSHAAHIYRKLGVRTRRDLLGAETSEDPRAATASSGTRT